MMKATIQLRVANGHRLCRTRLETVRAPGVRTAKLHKRFLWHRAISRQKIITLKIRIDSQVI
jgi:hypothetical protein